jgi:hypothetical protein
MDEQTTFCPACFFAIEGGVVYVDSVSIHDNPNCILSWGGYGAEQKQLRAHEARRLADESQWHDIGDLCEGYYWGKIPGSNTIRGFDVVNTPEGLGVRGYFGIKALDGSKYVFLRKAA